MAEFLRLDSREAEAWLLKTFGDKGQTLFDDLHRISTEHGLEFYVKTAVPVRIFTEAVAKRVNLVMTKEAEDLDCALGRISCGRKTATSKSTHIVKDLCLLALDKAGFQNEHGRPMSVNSFCKMLGWRRLDNREFTTEKELEQYDKELNYVWTVKESRQFLTHIYARLKEKF